MCLPAFTEQENLKYNIISCNQLVARVLDEQIIYMKIFQQEQQARDISRSVQSRKSVNFLV